MNKNIIGATFGTAMSAVGTGVQTNELLQTVSLVITIIGSLITIGMAIKTWYDKAKADGKFTKEEIKEGVDIIKDGVETINDKVKKGGKNDAK